MNDTVSMNATSPVTYVILGIPHVLVDHVRHITAKDGQGLQLQVSKLEFNGNLQPYRIDFLSSRQGNFSFMVRTVFLGLLRFQPQPSSRYSFSFSPFPAADNSVTVLKASLKVSTKGWPSYNVTGVAGTKTTDSFQAQANPLNSLNNTVAEITFPSAGSTQNNFEVLAGRTISISRTASVSISDSYNITNRGSDVQNIAFTLPKGVSSIAASDIIGPLEDTKIVAATPSADGTRIVTVTPRFGMVKNNGSVVLTLTYDLSSDIYLATHSLGGYTLSFALFNNVKFTENMLETKILVPTGFRLNSYTGPTPTVSGNVISFQVSPLSSLSDLSFSITYQLDPFWAVVDPLSWAALAEGALAAVLLVFAATSKAAVVGVLPRDIIGRFVDLYDEKAALRLEAEKMDEDLERGAVNRYDYKRRRRVIDLRTSEIDKQLAPAKEKLSVGQPRYQDLVKKIERAEAELQVVKTTQNDLKNQYRNGRLARELYESLVADLVRRKERAKQSIDNIMIGLREEAR